MLGILNMFELEEVKDRSEAEHLCMMNQYNLYKFIDAKSESLKDNHIKELKRDSSQYNFIAPLIYKLMLVAPKLQGAPK